MISFGEGGHLDASGPELRGGDDENGAINEQRGIERDSGIHQRVPALRAQGLVPAVRDALDDECGVEVKIVRHDGGADNAGGDVEALRADARNEDALGDLDGVCAGHEELRDEAEGDDAEEDKNDLLDAAHALALRREQQEGVEGGEHDAEHERDAEEQVDADGGAEHLGEVGGDDGELGHDPEQECGRARVLLAAQLGEVRSRDYAHARGEDLQQKCDRVGQHQHPEQLVAEARPALDVGGPVARVQVADGNEEGGAEMREHAAPGEGAALVRRLEVGAWKGVFIEQVGGLGIGDVSKRVV